MTDSSKSDIFNGASNNNLPTQDEDVLTALRTLLFSPEQIETSEQQTIEKNTSSNLEEDVLDQLRTLIFSPDDAQVDNVQQQFSQNNPATNPDDDVLGQQD